MSDSATVIAQTLSRLRTALVYVRSASLSQLQATLAQTLNTEQALAATAAAQSAGLARAAARAAQLSGTAQAVLASAQAAMSQGPQAAMGQYQTLLGLLNSSGPGSAETTTQSTVQTALGTTVAIPQGFLAAVASAQSQVAVGALRQNRVLQSLAQEIVQSLSNATTLTLLAGELQDALTVATALLQGGYTLEEMVSASATTVQNWIGGLPT